MNKEIAKQKDKANVVIQQLYSNPEIELKQDQINVILGTNPPANWVKTHPYIKGHKYISIEKTEFLLKKIFKKYKIEILREGTSFNGVYVVVRVWYKDPITGEMDFHDGLGAVQLQTAKGTSPADLNNINQGALSMSFPIAKTLAVKNACHHFGSLFGGNLNRMDVIPITPDKALEQIAFTKEEERVRLLIERAEDTATLENLKTHLTTHLQETYDKKWKNLEK